MYKIFNDYGDMDEVVIPTKKDRRGKYLCSNEETFKHSKMDVARILVRTK